VFSIFLFLERKTNWYKKYSQEMMDRGSGSYFDIGHELYDYGPKDAKKQEEQVWIWDSETGRFQSEKATSNLTHGQMFDDAAGYNRKDRGRFFEGRYENYQGNKRVSIKGRHREAPQNLIAELVAEYGKDIKIFTY